MYYCRFGLAFAFLLANGFSQEIVNLPSHLSTTPSCDCTRIYIPVCASSGVTYGNSCTLKCIEPSSRIVKYGECPENANNGINQNTEHGRSIDYIRPIKLLEATFPGMKRAIDVRIDPIIPREGIFSRWIRL